MNESKETNIKINSNKVSDIYEGLLDRIKDELWQSAIELADYRYDTEHEELKTKFSKQAEKLTQTQIKLEAEEAKVNQLRLELNSAEADEKRQKVELKRAKEQIIRLNGQIEAYKTRMTTLLKHINEDINSNKY
ncbi:hypothetical protein [Photobacterium sp. GSS17]|uniref:hypothetical protein n=1 Tax=Photobacterium sp. GSS17 TaxID=3020715 RepID=UPI002361F49C|nr:hypothetical protein [Photobacterium sp. GSS17]